MKCSDKSCAGKGQLCDGWNTCPDGADELNCGRYSGPGVSHGDFFLLCLPPWPCDVVELAKFFVTSSSLN
jgi:hypothetical protein